MPFQEVFVVSSKGIIIKTCSEITLFGQTLAAMENMITRKSYI